MRFIHSNTFSMMEATGLDIPEAYQSYIYPFTAPEYIAHPFVDQIIQETSVGAFRMASHVLFVKEPITLYPHTDESICTLYCMLKGNVECHMNGAENPVQLTQNQYFLFCINDGAHRAHFEPGVYQSFHINFPPEFLQEIAPVADPVLNITQGDQSAALTGSLFYPLYEAMEELRNCEVRSQFMDQRLENVMENMLLMVIERKPGSQADEITTPAINESTLGTVQNYIRYNPQRSLNLRAISRHYGLQPVDLQSLFVNNTPGTLEEFVFGHRMKLSHGLLKYTTMTIPEIIKEIGFPGRDLFTRAFRSVFNMSPAEARVPLTNL